MSQLYRPSCGSEGLDFIDRWCGRCMRESRFRQTRDGADACRIVARTFHLKVTDPDYPKEWIEDEAGPRCTAFEQELTARPAAAREE